MATPRSRLFVSPEEYLRREREAEERHEYDKGRIYAMAGESPNHSRICVNVTRDVSARLKGKTCEAFSSNMKVYVVTAGSLDAVVQLPSSDCQLPLPEVYDRVEFPPEEELEPEE